MKTMAEKIIKRIKKMLGIKSPSQVDGIDNLHKCLRMMFGIDRGKEK